MKPIQLSTALLLATTVAANATQITFDLTGEYAEEPSFAVVQNGITLTFSNPLGTNFTPDAFGRDGDGIAVLGGIDTAWQSSSWSFSFDAAVKLLSYNITYTVNHAGSSLTYSPDTAAGWTDNAFDTGSHDFSSQVDLGANENVDVTPTTAANNAAVQFASITVEANVPPVPLPGAVWGMIAGLGALGVAARRKSA